MIFLTHLAALVISGTQRQVVAKSIANQRLMKTKNGIERKRKCQIEAVNFSRIDLIETNNKKTTNNAALTLFCHK